MTRQIPTPEQIQERSLAIQREWTPDQRRSRRVHKEAEGVILHRLRDGARFNGFRFDSRQADAG